MQQLEWQLLESSRLECEAILGQPLPTRNQGIAGQALPAPAQGIAGQALPAPAQDVGWQALQVPDQDVAWQALPVPDQGIAGQASPAPDQGMHVSDSPVGGEHTVSQPRLDHLTGDRPDLFTLQMFAYMVGCVVMPHRQPVTSACTHCTRYCEGNVT